MKQKITTQSFVERAKSIHGNKYDYSKVEYINMTTKVCIICPVHGEFWIRPSHHLRGQGCKYCSRDETINNYNFKERAKAIYGDTYDVSKSVFTNSQIKVCIICPKHGEFWQTPNNFLHGHGCPKCGREQNRKKLMFTEDEIKEKIDSVYGKGVFEIVDYSDYKGSHKPIKIKSLINNVVFEQALITFLNGKSIYKKPIKKFIKRGDNETYRIERMNNFINKANKIHNGKYDYSKVNYVNDRTKVCIICPKHGEFWQAPNKHLKGQGCPKCKTSFLEQLVERKLISENIKFETHKFFKWLKMDGPQHLDFYLPDHNIAIECQGEQHYTKNTEYGKEFEKTRKRDENKYNLLKKNSIKLLYYTKKKFYKDDIHKECTFFSINDLLKEINGD